MVQFNRAGLPKKIDADETLLASAMESQVSQLFVT